MCGFAGIVDFSGHGREDARARVRRMADALAHRGPDEQGFYVSDTAALGHRRLSIIDLGSGQQPMAGAGGDVQVAFNGEIYNFRELRSELEIAGARFRTNSDTEVLLQGYLHWGEGCVERMHGMFAFAVWDERKHSLLLARDRVGKKPLYFHREGSRTLFASELKSLRASGFCPDAVDPEALDCYLSLGYIPGNRTIYAGVQKLEAAHFLIVDESGERLCRYWRLDFSTQRQRSLAQAVEEFEFLLDDAVRSRLVSEVPLGAFLSGGIDSSLVVSSMARILDEPVITNTIGFHEAAHSELGVAREIARYLGTEHHEHIVEPRAVDVLERIAWHFDEPLADPSALPTWYVCEMTRRTVSVALSGDGGDESFAGYTFRYRPHLLESRVRRLIPPAMRSLFFGSLGRVWPASAALPGPLRLKSYLENLATSDARAFYDDLVWLRADTRSQLYSADFLNSLRGFTPFEVVQPWYQDNGATEPLARCQFADIGVYMVDDVLVKVDRMSMAHSLEVRCPLLDHRILEFAATLPAGLKMNFRHGKLPLRELAARRLPERIHKLPKRGFSIPAARWLRSELRPVAEAVLFDGTGIVSRTLERQALRALWREHLDGSRDHSQVIWAIMMLGLWERAAGVAVRVKQ